MQPTHQRGGPELFQDLNLFTDAVKQSGFDFDFSSVVRLNTNFLEESENYLILNMKDHNDQESSNILFLTEGKAFLFSKNPPTSEALQVFQKLYAKPYGATTVLAFVTLTKVLHGYKEALEKIINEKKELELSFEIKRYRNVIQKFEILEDRLEDFHDIVLRLEERTIKEVQTRYISFDYGLLIAEATSILDRCRNRFGMLRDIARHNEMESTIELNRRIEKLNNVVKRLTAITVALMIPNIISSHFGMNFRFMPELDSPIAYPIVLISTLLVVGVVIFLFKKMEWL